MARPGKVAVRDVTEASPPEGAGRSPVGCSGKVLSHTTVTEVCGPGSQSSGATRTRSPDREGTGLREVGDCAGMCGPQGPLRSSSFTLSATGAAERFGAEECHEMPYFIGSQWPLY